MPITAYAGTDPYVFVSYSHVDSRLVNTQIEWLADNELNIWFDEGIEPTSRWTDELATRVKEAAAVVYFVTRSSANSTYCRNEVEYALLHDIPILVVYLKEAALPDGLSLALGGHQAILKHQLSAYAYQEKLVTATAKLLDRQLTEVTHRTSRAGLFAMTITFVLAIAVAGVWYVMPSSGRLQEPYPLLVADFENNTDDPLFTNILEEVLRIGLEGAPLITSYSKADAQRSLARINKDETVLDEKNARLVAMRESLKLVITGQIDPREPGYRISLRGLEPISGDLVFEMDQSAESTSSVIASISSLAIEVREALGDTEVDRSYLDDAFSTTSLEAVSAYVDAQALAAEWKHEDAVTKYELAIELDDDFGRAYSGLAYSLLKLGRTTQAQTVYKQTVPLMYSMTERERLRTLGMYYVGMDDFVKGRENFEELVAKYPADGAGRNNLAVAYFDNLEFDKAIEQNQALLEMFPTSSLYLGNHALFNMYDGQFNTAKEYADETLKVNAEYYMAYVPIAMAHLMEGEFQEAMDAYGEMANASEAGTRLSRLGMADLALARGDYESVIAMMLDAGADDPISSSNLAFSLLFAEALAESGNKSRAGLLAAKLTTIVAGESEIMSLAAVYVALGDFDEVRKLAVKIRSTLSRRSRSLSYVLEAQAEFGEKNLSAAIASAEKALDASDLWSAHFVRGRIYLTSGQLVQAMDEFEKCYTRIGQATAINLDDVPTYRKVVPIYYWLGRVHEEMSSESEARKNYALYVARRDSAENDDSVVAARLGLRSPGGEQTP
jgi:tetratricopeptide (TPR) repeat protein